MRKSYKYVAIPQGTECERGDCFRSLMLFLSLFWDLSLPQKVEVRERNGQDGKQDDSTSSLPYVKHHGDGLDRR